MKHKIAQVQIILNELSKIKNRPINKDGNLDVKKLNKLPEVISAKKELKKLGVNRKFLFKHFPIAGMIIEM